MNVIYVETLAKSCTVRVLMSHLYNIPQISAIDLLYLITLSYNGLTLCQMEFKLLKVINKEVHASLYLILVTQCKYR